MGDRVRETLDEIAQEDEKAIFSGENRVGTIREMVQKDLQLTDEEMDTLVDYVTTCVNTTFTPEDVFHGCIVMLELGDRLRQNLFKVPSYAEQKAQRGE
jgi:hypothetical protein